MKHHCFVCVPLKRSQDSWAWWLSIPAHGRQRQVDLRELEASLVWVLSSRPELLSTSWGCASKTEAKTNENIKGKTFRLLYAIISKHVVSSEIIENMYSLDLTSLLLISHETLNNEGDSSLSVDFSIEWSWLHFFFFCFSQPISTCWKFYEVLPLA